MNTTTLKYLIFDYDNLKDAKREFNRLYNQLDFLPEEIAKFMKNLKKDFDKTINHIKKKRFPKPTTYSKDSSK